MMKMPLIPKLALAGAFALCTLSISGPTQAISLPSCPRPIFCTDVWNPVICSDGQVYSNSCYAVRACATGCVPYGDTI